MHYALTHASSFRVVPSVGGHRSVDRVVGGLRGPPLQSWVGTTKDMVDKGLVDTTSITIDMYHVENFCVDV